MEYGLVRKMNKISKKQLLQNFASDNWPLKTIEYLVNNWSNTSREEIQKNLPGKTWGCIRKKACRMKLKREVQIKRWAAEETIVLETLYPIATWEELLKALPKRTKMSIIEKARNLNLKRIHKKAGKQILSTEHIVTIASLKEVVDF